MPKLVGDQKMDSILLLREKGLSFQHICDIITKEHDKMVDLLGGIKSNTKRGQAL